MSPWGVGGYALCLFYLGRWILNFDFNAVLLG
jgi:hypothetical protein